DVASWHRHPAERDLAPQPGELVHHGTTQAGRATGDDGHLAGERLASGFGARFGERGRSRRGGTGSARPGFPATERGHWHPAKLRAERRTSKRGVAPGSDLAIQFPAP